MRVLHLQFTYTIARRLAGTVVGPDTSRASGDVGLSPPLRGPEVAVVNGSLSTDVGDRGSPGSDTGALTASRGLGGGSGGAARGRARAVRGRDGSRGGWRRRWRWVGGRALAHVVADVVPLGGRVAGNGTIVSK